MKSYEDIINRAARFGWMVRSKHPMNYMPEVFGVTPTENPALEQQLLNASHCGGLWRLLDTLPRQQVQCIIHYITHKMD